MAVIGMLFDGIAPATRRALEDCRKTGRFAAGQDLFAMGEGATTLQHILAGRAKVWRAARNGHALTLYFMRRGDCVGLVALQPGRANPATVTAVTGVETEYWPSPVVLRLMQADARLAENALRLVSDKVVLLADRLEDVTGGRVDQQLSRALLRLAGEDGDWSGRGDVAVPVTRQDLADMTGTTLSTASRTLSGWQQRGLIRSVRGRVTIADPEALAVIADFQD